MDRCVFLDRDNTIVQGDGAGVQPERVRLVQGAANAIASLRGLGYRVVVVSNQDGVAEGDIQEEDVQAVNQRVTDLVHEHAGTSIDRFYYCPYHPQAKRRKYKQDHDWRLPQPGMLKQAADDLALNLPESWMVGDQIEDVEAGLAAGVRTILITAANQESKTPSKIKPDFTATSLSEAVRLIAQHHRPERQIQSIEKTHVSAGSVAGSVHVPAAAAKSDLAEEPAAQPVAAAPARVAAKSAAKAAATGLAATGSSARATATKTESKKETAAVESPVSEEATPAAVGSQTDELLRQILQAIRRQEADRDDFSPFKLAAGVVQMMTAIGVLFGLFYASSDPVVFIECFMGAMVGQLAVLALLVYHRMR